MTIQEIIESIDYCLMRVVSIVFCNIFLIKKYAYNDVNYIQNY